MRSPTFTALQRRAGVCHTSTVEALKTDLIGTEGVRSIENFVILKKVPKKTYIGAKKRVDERTFGIDYHAKSPFADIDLFLSFDR